MDVRSPSQVVHFRQRADTFYETARDLVILDERKYGPSVGLLAVHSCIAFADAVLVATQGQPNKSEDHKQAARALRTWCSATGKPESGIRHFEWLLDNKTKFPYGAKPVREEELKKAKVKMDQFFAWASTTFPFVVQVQGDQPNA